MYTALLEELLRYRLTQSEASHQNVDLIEKVHFEMMVVSSFNKFWKQPALCRVQPTSPAE